MTVTDGGEGKIVNFPTGDTYSAMLGERPFSGADAKHGGPGGGGPMDTDNRVTRLEVLVEQQEKRFDRFENKLDRLADGIGDVKSHVTAGQSRLGAQIAHLEGRISAMPTTFTIVAWMIGIAIAAGGLIFAVLRLSAGH